jgi:hypothetical protein
MLVHDADYKHQRLAERLRLPAGRRRYEKLHRSGWVGWTFSDYLFLALAISTIRRCAVVILSGNVRVPAS